MRDYKSTVTGGSFMEARGEGFLNLVRDSLRLSGRRPELEQIGDATKLTIYAAQYEDEGEEIYAHEKREVKIPGSCPPPGSRYR